ncbi:MAG TPA: serine/threonine-protein kinase, partial [Gemmatimonas sp.]|nr:serine/threonine-protein kinase [Gemmatimonas sp.]
ASLQEPHIVPMLSAGMTGEGLPYYTMPFVHGDTLRARLQAGPLPIAEGIGILRNIAQALAYANARGIVHRDIKPDNVLLSSGTAVVTDFGIAKAVTASTTQAPGATLTSIGTSIGTPAYMAPEQALGDAGTDHRADLYAWGVVAYEVLAGAHPFADRVTPQALVAAHISEPAHPLRQRNADVPAAIADVVMQCLAKDPQQRPATADDVLARLASVTTTPEFAGAPGSPSPAARSSRAPAVKYRVIAAVAAMLIVTAAVVGRDLLARRGAPTTSPRSMRSLAVLPFADLSADGASAYLGDGVAETLINALSRVPGLTVSARTSAFSFRGRENELETIGEQLGVSTVLMGSIQRAGDQLRVTARVVQIANDSILWAQSFDRPAADIFAVQDEVARDVVSAMQFTLAATPEASETVGATRSAEAYDAYLLGRYYWNLRTTDGIVRATNAFKKAITIDSTYARAWSGLADSYVLSVPGEYSVPGVTRASILPSAETAARRAIAIAPTLGEAHVSLAQVMAMLYRRAESLAAFERGIVLSPAYATGRQWYAYELMDNGRTAEGIREMEIAHRLDPLSHVITLSLAIAYDGVERHADAAPLYTQGLGQSPEAWYAWRARFGHDLATGNTDAAAIALLTVAQDSAADKIEILRRLAPQWKDSSTRGRATDELIASGPLFAAIPLARRLRNDSVAVQVFDRYSRVGAVNDYGAPWFVYVLLGPRLSKDPRMEPGFRRLGFPASAMTPTPR